jgi:outer membrane lipoprotein LolB
MSGIVAAKRRHHTKGCAGVLPLAFPNSLFLNVFSLGCRRIATWAVVLVTLAGCSLLRPAPEMAIPDVGGFAVTGRMAVRQANDGFSSSFMWQHAADLDEIELWGPLGQGRSRLVGEAGRVTVYTAKGEVFKEASVEAGMQRWLGFTFPLDALTYWVRGRPAPGVATQLLRQDEQGDLAMLEQLGWQLEFSRYRDEVEARRLPGRIIAVRGNIKVTLLPGEWSFARAPG